MNCHTAANYQQPCPCSSHVVEPFLGTNKNKGAEQYGQGFLCNAHLDPFLGTHEYQRADWYQQTRHFRGLPNPVVKALRVVASRWNLR